MRLAQRLKVLVLVRSAVFPRHEMIYFFACMRAAAVQRPFAHPVTFPIPFRPLSPEMIIAAFGGGPPGCVGPNFRVVSPVIFAVRLPRELRAARVAALSVRCFEAHLFGPDKRT